MSCNLRECVSQVLAQLCSQVGFERITESSLDLLVTIVEQFIQKIGLDTQKIADLYEEDVHLEHVSLALRFFGESVGSLQKFCEENAPFFTSPPVVSCGPLYGKILHHPLSTIESPAAPNSPECSNNVDASVNGRSQVSDRPSNAISVQKTSTGINSSITPNRRLPKWANQTTYRISRVSVDPITHSLIEHAPPEKISDTVFDDDLYMNQTSPVYWSEPAKPDQSNSAKAHSPQRQGVSDAQWAAALKATSSQPIKRIVFTPTRFDPSVHPAYVPSLRRSSAITTSKPSSIQQAVKIFPKVSVSITRPPAPKSSAYARTKSHRRGSFKRTRRWMRKTVVNTKTLDASLASSETVNPSINTAVDETNTREPLSPSVDKTPPLRSEDATLLVSESIPSSPLSSDTTPPAESPGSAFILRKDNFTPVTSELPLGSSVQVCESTDNKFSSLDDDRIHYGAAKPSDISPPCFELKSSSSPIYQKQSEDVAESIIPCTPPVRTNRVSSIGRKRSGRGRRRAPPQRTSFVESLFQNPLRQVTPKQAINVATRSNSAGLQSATSRSTVETEKLQMSGSVNSHHTPEALAPATRQKTKSSVISQKSVSPIKHSSPMSDSTEPMTCEERSRLLIIQSPDDTVLSEAVSPVLPTTFESKPFTFTGHNFDTPRIPGPKFADLLPSSPSSIDSSLSSSASSISAVGVTARYDSKVVKIEKMDAIPTGSEVAKPTLRVFGTPSNTASRSHYSPSSSSLTSTMSSIGGPLMKLSTPQSSTSSVPTATCPPPLLPLSSQTQLSCVVKSHPSSSETCSVESNFARPPLLVPVTEFAPTTANLSVSSRRTTTLTDRSIKPEHRTHLTPSVVKSSPGKCETLYEKCEKVESLASLSPSSSSSSSSSLGSSESTLTSPVHAQRMPPHFATLPAVIEPIQSNERTHKLSPPVTSCDQQNFPPTPKITIRLGTGSNTTCITSSSLPPDPKLCTPTTEKSVINSPPRLKLTISRDRLAYRGARYSSPVDSNASSSSSGSMVSSDDDDDEEDISTTPLAQVPNSITALPPPPLLKRLPDRLVSSTPIKPTSLFPISSAPILTSEKPSLPPVIKHELFAPATSKQQPSDLPPLLPLATPIACKTLPSSVNTATPTVSASTRGKKRARSARKSKMPSPKRRLISAKTSTHTSNESTPLPSNDSLSRSSRVRVASIFTDDEEDACSNKSAPSHPVSTGKFTIHSNQSGSMSITSANLLPLAEDKHIKGRPRTKHTAKLTTPKYKSVVKPPMAKTSSSTTNSPLPSAGQHACAKSASSSDKIGKEKSHVILASAGSSYYFNNSGEQIWLCPVCRLEDDGNLMIGCDSCDDWYHSTCLGLAGEPTVAQWFCPKCARQSTAEVTRTCSSVLSTASSGGPTVCGQKPTRQRMREQIQLSNTPKVVKHRKSARK